MTVLPTLLLLLAAPASPPDQPFRLEPGDFRWTQFTVRQIPTEVDCHFEVAEGGATVHAELLPIGEFRLFDRGRDHDTLALTSLARRGAFRRIIDTRGQYAVVLVNQKGAAPVTVSLHVATTVDPGPGDVAQTLSPRRRLAVILISFAFFFVTLSGSSWALIRTMRDGPRESS